MAVLQRNDDGMYRNGKVWLSPGGHATRKVGVCVMEYVAYLAGEKHNDTPRCVDAGLGGFARSINDELGEEHRQHLKPLAVRTLGTYRDGQAEDRAYMALDWMVHEYLKAWAEYAEAKAILTTIDNALRITDGASLTNAKRQLDPHVDALPNRQRIARNHVVPISSLVCTNLPNLSVPPSSMGPALCNQVEILATFYSIKYPPTSETYEALQRVTQKVQGSLIRLFGDLCDPGGIHDIPDPLAYEMELYDKARKREMDALPQ